MKKVILTVMLLVVLISTQVKAFELNYSGQKDFSVSMDWVFDPETGVLKNEPYLKLGQSLQLYIHGEDENGYLRGFLTDHPAMLEEIYLDMNLGNFKLQWDDFNEGFLRPSWFSLEHKFTGLRASYSHTLDEAAFLGVSGKNHWREEDMIVEPAQTVVREIQLNHSPAVLGSVQVWLNGEQLRYTSEFYLDTEKNVLKLLVPIQRTSHLRIRYLQESNDYLVFGGRIDHHFPLVNEEVQLDAGVIYLQTSGEEGQHKLIGTEWLYQPKPWWFIELNAGAVLEPLALNSIAAYFGNEQNGTASIASIPQAVWEPNWRVANQFSWTNLNISADYQVVSNRFQDLLNLGSEGRHLHLDALYTGDRLLLKHRQDYHWTLGGIPRERNADVEVMWILPDWVPYFYYSQYQWDGMLKQNAMAELGYQIKLPEDNGSLTYLMGADMKHTSEDTDILANTKPYLGMRYQREKDQSLGLRVYGERGLQFDQLVVFGDWYQGSTLLKGQVKYQPGSLQLDNTLTWDEEINVQFNWVQTQYFYTNEGYLNLNLNLNFSPITGMDDQLWLNLTQENNEAAMVRSYKFGGEKAIGNGRVVYGEMGISQKKKSLSGGLRGFYNWLEYDASYTGSEELEQRSIGTDTTEQVEDLVYKNGVAFSVGAEDYIRLSGDLEVTSKRQFVANLDLSYPLLKDVTMGVHYSGNRDVSTTYHMVEVRTVYHF